MWFLPFMYEYMFFQCVTLSKCHLTQLASKTKKNLSGKLNPFIHTYIFLNTYLQECSWSWTCLACSKMDAYRQDNILCHFTILRWTPVIGYSFYWSHILLAYKSKQNTLAIAQDGYTMIEINPFSSSGKPCTMYNWKDGLNHKRIPRLVISL